MDISAAQPRVVRELSGNFRVSGEWLPWVEPTAGRLGCRQKNVDNKPRHVNICTRQQFVQYNSCKRLHIPFPHSSCIVSDKKRRVGGRSQQQPLWCTWFSHNTCVTDDDRRHIMPKAWPNCWSMSLLLIWVHCMLVVSVCSDGICNLCAAGWRCPWHSEQVRNFHVCYWLCAVQLNCDF